MSRFLVVSGARTALRLKIPELGALRVGSSLECDVVSVEEGVEAVHAELFFSPKLGVRAHASDVARIDPSDEMERPVSTGETVDLAPHERVRVGPLEIALADGLPPANDPRLWDRVELERRAEAAGEGVIIRLKEDAELVRRARQRLRSVDVLATLGAGELAIFLAGARLSDARVLIGDLGPAAVGMAEMGPHGPAVALEAARAGPSVEPVSTERLPSVDPAMAPVEELLAQAAQSDEPTLVLGETGAGKDLLVHELHRRSSRASFPLVRVSAVEISRDGLPEDIAARARRGTLLLSEVSALSPAAQLALTRDLERSTTADIRIVATSNQNLDRLVRQDAFRKDLFFRIARFRIEIPPLRARPADIEAFARAFLSAEGLTEEPSRAAFDALRRYPWPGNVRELESVIARAFLASRGGPIGLEHLPSELQDPGILQDSLPATMDETIEIESDQRSMSLREEMAALERRRILEALDKHPTQTDAAKALGIPLRTFLNRMDALGIPRARKK